VTKVGKKVVQSSAKKAGKKLSEVAVGKGSDEIQRILQKRRPKTPAPKAPSSRQKTSAPKASSRDATIKLSQILGNQESGLNRLAQKYRTPRAALAFLPLSYRKIGIELEFCRKGFLQNLHKELNDLGP